MHAGWAGLEVDAENVCMIGDVPHSWLFPQMAAAVHHAGAGTIDGSMANESQESTPEELALQDKRWEDLEVIEDETDAGAIDVLA